MRAVLLALLASAVAAVVAPAALAFPKLGPGCVRADYASGGHAVPAQLCRPSNAKTAAPAVLILYGCGRFDSFTGSLAQELPRTGIATLYIDYFAGTPPPAGNRGFCVASGGAYTVGTWLREITAGAAALRRTSGINPHRVGVVAWSMGGAVALDAAAGGPGRVQRPFDAMVIYSSWDGGPLLARARRLPPTLLLSAGTTDAAPMSGALALHRALQAAHVPTELHIWPHGLHGWQGAQGVKALGWTARFLRRYLWSLEPRPGASWPLVTSSPSIAGSVTSCGSSPQGSASPSAVNWSPATSPVCVSRP